MKLRDLQIGSSKLKRVSFTKEKFDGTKAEIAVAIRVLTKMEMDLARANALTSLQSLKLQEGRTKEELLEEARIVEILAVACRDPDKPDEPWSEPMTLGMTLTQDEITALWEHYCKHQQECSPMAHDMSNEEYDALVELIAKEGSADPLALCAWPLRNAFTVTLARQREMYRMQSLQSSSGSTEPPTESATKPESGAAADLEALAEAARALGAELPVLREMLAGLVVRVNALERSPEGASE